MTLRRASIALCLSGLMAMGLASSASAQNHSQIDSVRRGKSCPGCNLFQAELSGLQASGLDLSRSRLRQASMALVTMQNTRFNGADMRDVDAYGGVLTRSNFSRADLTNASFVGAWLQNSSFAGATLTDTNFSGANLSGATGLTQGQLNRACGDDSTRLPAGLNLRAC